MIKNVKERRRYPRLDVYHLAKYRLISQPESDLITAHIKDIGGGGVCLLLNEEIPVNSTIQIYINFPELTQPIPCIAKIAWVKRIDKLKKYKAGVEFLEIEDIFRDIIINRIEYVREKIEKKEANK